MLNAVVSGGQFMGLRDVQTQMGADPFTLVTPKSISGFFEDSVVAVAIWITVCKSARSGCRCRVACLAGVGGHGFHCAAGPGAEGDKPLRQPEGAAGSGVAIVKTAVHPEALALTSPPRGRGSGP